jgi:hypothetical protein
MTLSKVCYQLLSDADGFKARCLCTHGVEHSHHDGTARESVLAGTAMDVDELHDFTVAHGDGPPTPIGYECAARLIAAGDDYATAAAEVVARGLVRQHSIGRTTA